MFFLLCVLICLLDAGISTLHLSSREEDVCASKVCFRRCCSNQNQAMSLKFYRCETQNVTLDVRNFTEYIKSVYGIQDDVSVLHSDGVLCANGTHPVFIPNLTNTTFGGNRFHMADYDADDENHDYLDHCFEFFRSLSAEEEFTFSAIICYENEISTPTEALQSGMIISMPFLLVTFVVYALLPDRNLHQKALMFYVLTLLIAYILLVTINLSNEILMPWCSVIAYATIFSFMSSFFWMNVICFDIWYTFSGGRGFVGSKRSTERRRLIYYSLYALGGPLLILGLIGLMQTVLPDDSNHNPNIGVKMCFLNDGWANLWYFYLEAGILVLVNVIFFTLTALKIRKVKKETSMLNHNDSKRHSYEKDKQKDQRAIYGFNLYIKLLFAMGVNWSMEVISWAINWRTANELQYIWYVTDTFNAIYGVFIFFIFVFKKKIWSLLQKRYYNFIGKPHLAHTVTTNQTRTSHYSSTNYSTADTQLTDTNGRPSPEEMGLRTLS
ncbi:probable G-protein coupled receptor Mth-like 10 isoform X7 [Euwallacea fornicatus]|uniref:probable G-protein coupled receptor Mth-like 10 isoform X7 n=1 Tax=Euwallacea fornicatus TaxID=995702 RepID=UPI00338F8C51